MQAKDIRHFSKLVVSALQPLLDVEFSDIEENEVQAAMEAVNNSFEHSSVDLFDCSLDPALYADEVIKEAQRTVDARLLSEVAQQFYERVVLECSVQLIHFVSTWPSFLAVVNAEQLARVNQLLTETDRIRWAVSGQPQTEEGKFESRYKRHVVQKLDQLELFGLTLADPDNRSYPLSTAYISLTLADSSLTPSANASISGGISFQGAPNEVAAVSSTPGSFSTEIAISAFDRILLRGDAGSGKTTLLYWLAVNAARSTLEGTLESLSNYVPFVLPLRRFADRDLPAPQDFLSEVGRNLAGEMPNAWVHGVLRSGRCLVLIDGVDELPEDRRQEAKVWLQELIALYPNCRYIITSRPAAAEERWLAREGFASLDLLPMGKSDIGSFIRHWHAAARESMSEKCDDADFAELDAYERELITQVNTQRQLRRLASNPLLCALLCTLNRDRRMQLPQGRMELYAAALEMLLVRRDNERKIAHPDSPNLTLHQKKHVLGVLAYWLLRNGLTDCSQEQAVEQITNALSGMPSVNNSGISVFKYLMVRSGVLRAPVEGRVDFVHRTFQEYLAAESLISANDVGVLIEHAHLDQWHEAVTMAVGHARAGERKEILNLLLSRGKSEPEYLTRLHLLAAACLENADELDANTYQLVRRCAEALIPPTKFSESKELAAAGEVVLALLPRSNKRLKVNEAASVVRAAALIGGDAALEVVASYSQDDRRAVQKELTRNWSQFDTQEYAARVIARSPAFKKRLVLDHADVLPVLQNFNSLTSLGITFEVGELTWVRKLPKLSYLRLAKYSGSLTDDEVGALASIKSLNISFASAESRNATLPRLRNLPKLGRLVLSGLSGHNRSSLSDIPDVPKLRDLIVINCTERPVDIDSEKFPELRSISLHRVDMAAGGTLNLDGIEGFQDIESITLQADNFQGLEKLRMLPKLQTVELLLVDPQAFDDLAANTANVKHVKIIAHAFNRNTYTLDLGCFRRATNLLISVETYGRVEVVAEGLEDPVRLHIRRHRR
ncbi:NACHT domain-containing protein [Streptomyces sp. NPDC006875]|uniref:NACHT domain-containing protein n=1 Tax=Streptomyces sp. NPDC006875 TaxID=3154781 RepID=UPI0033ECFBCB